MLYAPSDADLKTLGDVWGEFDALDPPWYQLRAKLIETGFSPLDVEVMTVMDLVVAARKLGGLRLGPGLSVGRGKAHVKVTEQQMSLLKALHGRRAIPVTDVMNKSRDAIWHCVYQRDEREKVRKAVQRLSRKLSAGGVLAEVVLEADDLILNLL